MQKAEREFAASVMSTCGHVMRVGAPSQLLLAVHVFTVLFET
jgi:hypothetical protein